MPRLLAERIRATGIMVVDDPQHADYLLLWQDETLVLTGPDGSRLRAQWKRPHAANTRQPFTRALAPVRHGRVIDATAGLGGDSLQLALMADEVIAIERHPVVFALLVASIHKARRKGWPAAEKIDARFGDACAMIPELPATDVIFLDPMFPPRRKQSALPPNTVRMLRGLVGDDTDSERLFETALRCARRRVVVKRPLHAPPMGPEPRAMHEGKVVRYEVHAPRGDVR